MRVYCRVKPSISGSNERELVKIQKTGSELPIGLTLNVSEKNSAAFHFDGIFDAGKSQQ